MKVVALNGSANKSGNTALALAAASKPLEEQGIAVERIDIGSAALHGCVGCGLCRQRRNRECRFTDDPANGWMQKLFEADGILLGAPVYFAGVNGAAKSFLDRAFFVAGANGSLFRHKVGAGVVAVRRAGALTAIDQLNKYFTIAEMIVPGSNYWNLAFGMTQGEAAEDAEGMQTMRILGANMAWLLKIIELGKKTLPPPAFQEKERMNFIR